MTNNDENKVLMEQLRKHITKPFDLKGLDNTKTVRNFLCDYLTVFDLVISYAPASEFSSRSKTLAIAGGWICENDIVRDRYVPVDKLNFRIIRCLYNAGFLKVRDDLQPPHPRCVMLGWSAETKTYQREILRAHILNSKHGVTARTINAIADSYGVKLEHIKSKGLFEIVRLNGEAIAKGKTPRTWVLANPKGEPVNRYKDMTENEWEDTLYRSARKAGAVNKPADVPHKQTSHYSVCKRAN